MYKSIALVVGALFVLSLSPFEANAAQEGASKYAPGQLAKRPGAKAAKYYAPGQRAKKPGAKAAKDYAPGQR